MKNNKFKFFWISAHSVIFLLLLIFFVCGIKYKINTNLFDILPKTNASLEVSHADSVMNSIASRSFIVLVKASSLEKAKSVANQFYKILNTKKEFFEKINLFVSDDFMSEITNYFFENRFKILNEENIDTLNSEEKISDFIAESLLNLYVGSISTNAIEQDPFLLSEVGLSNALSKIIQNGTSMSVQDGVLCTFVEQDCYVMIRGILTKDAASITNKSSGVKLIYETSQNIQNKMQNNDEVKFIFSGVPFHSYESSSSAQKEITIISIVSMFLIILLCYFIFRSGLPIVFSVLAITMSALFAIAGVFIIFKEIHILTFVFGTTLIGTCLDYSVHFFVRWKADKNLNSGQEIRNHLFKGITLSFVSTEICYVALFFAPFVLLKQVAVFSFCGILSSYLTVICLYPFLKLPKKQEIFSLKNTNIFQNKISEFFIKNSKYVKKISFLAIVLLIVIGLIVAHKNVKIENNLRSFYSMKGTLLQNEIEANKVLDTGSSGWYFIIRGNSQEEVLENEYNFCKQLDEYINKSKSNKMTYNSITKYIPPMSLQKKSYEAVKKLFPYLKEQYQFFGFNQYESEIFEIEFKNEYKLAAQKNIDLQANIPEFMKDAINNLWIGKVDNQYFSVVMPMHFSDSKFCKELSVKDDNVFFMNKMVDVEAELNKLTKLMFLFLIIAFCVMTIVLKFFFKLKDVIRIIIIPIVTVLGTITVFALIKIPLGFFSVTGIILVFGLGIDYIIYSVENSEKLNTVAVLLSFLSSALSFGALALSSFAPVFMFGLAVFVGLLIAVLCTVLLKETTRKN